MSKKSRYGGGKKSKGSSSSFSSREEPKEFDSEQLKNITNYEKQYGDGSYSVVYGGMLETQEVAVKIYGRGSRVYWQQEIMAVSELNHPNIVKLLGYGETHDASYPLVLEMMPSTLKDKIQGLTWGNTSLILKQIALGLQHVDEKDSVIGDLKPDNILIDEHGNTKICDFGSAKKGGNGIMTVNKRYAAMEVVNSGKGSSASDVYSLGVIMLQLLTKTEDVGTVPREKNFLMRQVTAYMSGKSNSEDIHISAKVRVDMKKKGYVRDWMLRDSGCDDATATTLTELGVKCTEERMDVRPTIGEVVSILEGLN